MASRKHPRRDQNATEKSTNHTPVYNLTRTPPAAVALPRQRAYNAGMSPIPGTQIDAHLCAGGTGVAASDRAARATLAAFHRARRAEGREAWYAPRVLDWQSFVRAAWEERTPDLRLPLNALQEQSLWEEIIAGGNQTAALLSAPRRNLASMAMRAHALLCLYAPQLLNARSRATWTQDPGAFSQWLSAFDSRCRDEAVVSANRLPLETTALLKQDSATRPSLLLVGFDRVLPAQEDLFDAWGQWQHATPAEPAEDVRFYSAPDAHTELAACAAWCNQQLLSAPHSRLLVIAQDVQTRRGEFERAFLQQAQSNPQLSFEFSLGVPLSQTAPVRTAQMLLRWLTADLAENELDWLFSTHQAASPAESSALQSTMRALRHRNLQRPQWKLRTFLNQHVTASPLPASWVQRMRTAESRLKEIAQRERSPMDWAEIVPQLLELAAWPGESSLSSAQFQVVRRWQQAVESCGSLGFDGRRMNWPAFLTDLDRVTDETLFAPESEDAPILIAGPAESAGITADAVWFLGATDDDWPARGDLNPLLPIDVQRRANMPHSSAQVDWDLAHAVTARLLTSAPHIRFSYPHLRDGVEMRPSRLAQQVAGPPKSMPDELAPLQIDNLLTVTADDIASISCTLPADGAPLQLRGGSALLTAQSQCAFKAFAVGRLDASSWNPAEHALTPPERGQLLHAVLHRVWSGPPHGIRSLAELQTIPDLESFVSAHVDAALSAKALARIREEMPARYLELEARRLTRLIAEWLRYERTRVAFSVLQTELDQTTTIGKLALTLRIDRIDRLNDDTLLVIDYKTGNVSQKSWDLPRPDDVQLPLYAGFGLAPDETVGGLAFAKVRAGEMCFAGRVANAKGTLDSTLTGASSLVKYPMSAEQLMDWRDAIEQLARDFIAGRADVDPRDRVQTCDACGLQTLCRIHERPSVIDPEAEEPDE